MSYKAPICSLFAQGGFLLRGVPWLLHLFTYYSVPAGILISSASQPVLRKNKIFGGKAAGIEVTNGGGGVIEENEVFDNYFDGICLATGVNPTLKGVCVCVCVCVCVHAQSISSLVHVHYYNVFTKCIQLHSVLPLQPTRCMVTGGH